MRICYFGTYDAGYSRNRILIDGLRLNGVEVIECQATLWRGTPDKVRMARGGGWLRPTFWLRLLQVYSSLARRERALPAYDALVLGYSGQFDVPLARRIAHRRGVPLVLDAFMSLWLILQERGIDRASPFTSWIVRTIERYAVRAPDRLLMDTAEYRSFLCRTYGVPEQRISLIPTGADDRVFTPAAQPLPKRDSGRFVVVQYGTLIPLHGVETVIRAASLLARDHPDVHFRLIGEGPQRAGAEALVRELELHNVEFTGWMEKSALLDALRSADLALGVFGDTRQGRWTIQNKIYECMALGLPLITGAGGAVEAAFEAGRDLWAVPRADPAALAAAIAHLRQDEGLRAALGLRGRAAFERGDYGVRGIGARAAKILAAAAQPSRAAA